VAEQSLADWVIERNLAEIDPEAYPVPLREPRATFVTLRIGRKLRGCMGSLTVREPLVRDVAQNAVAAASRDSRFAPVTPDELPKLDLHLSILSPAEPIDVRTEEELLRTMRIGVDGLILHEGQRRSTLLPAVWENVATPREFLTHLKRKAGLAAYYWSDTIRFERYTADSLHKPVD
jgi:AmmeMemoRadiSam system protein A